jgi:serine protease SohB
MDWIANYGLFLLETVTVVIAVVVIIAAIGSVATKHKATGKEGVEIIRLNQRYDNMATTLKSAALEGKAAKKFKRQHKKEAKKTSKKSETEEPDKKRTFVIDFHGDLRASAVISLREEITAVLTAATPDDEVVVRLESGGGMVHAYGLAASQLMRLRTHKIPLIVTVDKVAASGGYMMACVANQIMAAPFAVVGSIGVLSQIPNFNRLLKKHDIDFEQFTAGEYKRTVTLFGETTDKDREKLKEELEETHTLFKSFVQEGRPDLDIDKVATGEHWFGTRALELGLIDQIRTSDDYLLGLRESSEILQVKWTIKKPIAEKISSVLSQITLRSQQSLLTDPINQEVEPGKHLYL